MKTIMVLETLAATTIGYLISNIQKSKGGQQAADELSTALWEWVRPIFLKDEEPIKDLKENPEDQDNQHLVALKIKQHLKKNPEDQVSLKNLLEKLEASDQSPASVKITQTHYGSGDNIGRDKVVHK